MPETNNARIRTQVLNPQGQPLGGTVDIEFKPRDVGQIMNVKGADASKDIDVSDLQRTPQELSGLRSFSKRRWLNRSIRSGHDFVGWSFQEITNADQNQPQIAGCQHPRGEP